MIVSLSATCYAKRCSAINFRDLVTISCKICATNDTGRTEIIQDQRQDSSQPAT